MSDTLRVGEGRVHSEAQALLLLLILGAIKNDAMPTQHAVCTKHCRKRVELPLVLAV